MKRKIYKEYRQDLAADAVKQPIIKILFAGTLIFGILVFCAAHFPNDSTYFMYVAAPFGVLGLLSLIWFNARPSLYARFFFNVGFCTLLIINSFRAFDYLFPQFSIIGGGLIASIVVFAHALPMQNPSLANLIRREMFAPTTRMGKILFRISLMAIPVILLLGIPAGLIFHKDPKIASYSLIMFTLGLLLAIIMPYSYRSPSSPWEYKNTYHLRKDQ